MAEPVCLRFESTLPAPLERVWEWITSVRGISAEMWPWLRMTVPGAISEHRGRPGDGGRAALSKLRLPLRRAPDRLLRSDLAGDRSGRRLRGAVADGVDEALAPRTADSFQSDGSLRGHPRGSAHLRAALGLGRRALVHLPRVRAPASGATRPLRRRRLSVLGRAPGAVGGVDAAERGRGRGVLPELVADGAPDVGGAKRRQHGDQPERDAVQQ